MTPGEREYGERIGRLIGKVDAIGDQLTELRRVNSEEHRHTASRFGDLERKIDSLESDRDKLGAVKAAFVGAAGAGLTLLGIFIGHP